MTTQFLERFKEYSQDELIEVVINKDEFQEEAVAAAKIIISEKGWTDELKKRLEEDNIRKTKEEELLQQEIIEKADYYKNLVEFRNDNNSFQIRVADVPKFEAALVKKRIRYFREDKNIGVQLDNYPTQTYFFKNEDVEQVDEITRKLKLVTAPYADIKPFFRFEIKVVLIAIAITVLLILLLR